MADKSKIEWTDATWNPIAGCTKVSPGCVHCYALRHTVRLAHNPKIPEETRKAYRSVVCKDGGEWEWTGEIVQFRDRLEIPLHWKKPRRVFVCSMSDMFHRLVRWDFMADMFDVMARCPQHTFQILTKRPFNMHQMMHVYRDFEFNKGNGIDKRLRFPLPNVWGMVSVENQEFITRIESLLKAPFVKRGVSAEPLLGRLNLRFYLSRLDFVIAGCESGPGRRSTERWLFANLKDQCQGLPPKVPFFLKQMEIDGKIVKLPMLDGRIWDELPICQS